MVPAARGRGARLTLVMLVAFLLAPATAQADAPTLLSVGSGSGHPTARWALPAGVFSRSVEVGTSRSQRPNGEFTDLAVSARVGARQESWRSSQRLDPGIYFVHVGGVAADCRSCPEEWSNVRKLVIRTARRYAGRTGQGRGISFSLTGLGTRIQSLEFRFRASCAGGVVSGVLKFRSPIVVGADRRFSTTVRTSSAIDSVSYRVRGRLIHRPFAAPHSIARGIVRFTATRSPAGPCDSGPIPWTARGQG